MNRRPLVLIPIVLLGIALPTVAAAGDTPTLAIDAIELSPGAVVYAIRVTHGGQAAVGDLTLEVKAPGGLIDEVLSQPLGSPVHEGPGPGTVTWHLKSLPARALVGPFALRVAFHGKPTPVRVVLRWALPTAGELKAASASVQEATETVASARLAARDLTKVAGTGLSYSLASGPLYSAPLGPPGSSADGLWMAAAGTGVRFFVPAGDLGSVMLARSDEDPPAGTGDGHLAWVGGFAVDQEGSGAAIAEVPLRRPAPPYSLVRVFLDRGTGFHEQPTLGTVSPDGLHAAFAADGTGTYALGVDGRQLDAGIVDLGPAGDVRKGLDPTTGATSLFQESYSEVFALGQMADALLGLLQGQTSAGKSQDGPRRQWGIDTDGDGYSDWLEIHIFQTDPDDPDTDDDGLSDGDEPSLGTDPHDADSDGDGVEDGTEEVAGTDPTDADSDDDDATDGEELEAGTDPLDPDSDDDGVLDGDDDDSFAPIPGCGGWGTCFSIDGGGTLLYLSDIELSPVLEGVLHLPESSSVILSRGIAAGLGTEVDGGDLRSVLGVAGDALFVVIPGGQRVGVTLDRPLLAPPSL